MKALAGYTKHRWICRDASMGLLSKGTHQDVGSCQVWMNMFAMGGREEHV